VILPATETRTLHAKPTQAVDILAFVEAQEISSLYFENRYHLAPAPGDENGYTMLRETLRRSRQIGIAYVVIQGRQHLAAVVPQDEDLILNTLRWTNEPYADEGPLSDDEELLAACSIVQPPPEIGHSGATRQDHRWRHRDAFHADVTMLGDGLQSEALSSFPEAGNTDIEVDDGLVEIDDCLADLLHRRAHRQHALGAARARSPHQRRHGPRLRAWPRPRRL
jgi:hypothetical protein